ncbi:MAG: DUF4292 domain-containing protein [Lachnoclostridium sp.]|nr:DUF4292 domain-containing protein [Lachnoclostridium sp.]
MTVLKKSFTLLISLSILLLLGSCGSSRKAAESSEVTSGDISAIVATYTPWESLSVPVSLNLRQPVSLKVSATMTMRRDEYVHISARFLGMEVGALMITRDSVFAKEKLHKTYVAESLAALTGDNKITLDNVQQMIFGHLFVPGETGFPPRIADIYTMTDYKGFRTVTPRDISRYGNFTFTFDSSTDHLTMLSADIRNKYPVAASYSDYVNTAAGDVAGLITISASASKMKFDAGIDCNYGKAKWNSTGTKTWETPRGYSKITVDKLLKSLSL